MLDMFFDIFRIKAPSWYNSFLTGKRITGKLLIFFFFFFFLKKTLLKIKIKILTEKLHFLSGNFYNYQINYYRFLVIYECKYETFFFFLIIIIFVVNNDMSICCYYCYY